MRRTERKIHKNIQQQIKKKKEKDKHKCERKEVSPLANTHLRIQIMTDEVG